MAFYIDDSGEPARSWQSALRQLADTLCPRADIEIDPADPEASCARIAEAAQRAEQEKRRSRFGADIAKLPQDELHILLVEVQSYLSPIAESASKEARGE